MRRTVTALLGVGLLALTVALIRPAGTDPIAGADGATGPAASPS